MSKIQNIITIQKDGQVQTWASLKKACKILNLPYWTLSRKKFPFEFDGYKFTKTKIQ